MKAYDESWTLRAGGWILVLLVLAGAGCRQSSKRARPVEPVDPIAEEGDTADPTLRPIEPPLEEGWSAYPTARHVDPPGTVFRVDEFGVRHPVTVLSRVTRHQERVPVTRRNGIPDRDPEAVATFLAGGILPAGFELTDEERMRFHSYDLELTGPMVREWAEDTGEFGLEEELAALVKGTDFEPVPGSEYYIVRATLGTERMRARFSASTVAEFGGEDRVRILSRASGAQVDNLGNALDISWAFEAPRRVLYRADRILLDGFQPRFVPVTDLIWREEVASLLCDQVRVRLHTTTDDKASEHEVSLILTERGKPADTRVRSGETWLPGESIPFTFPLDPPMPLVELDDLGVELLLDVDPMEADDHWQVAVEAVGRVEDGREFTLIRKTRSIELGADVASKWEQGFRVTEPARPATTQVARFKTVEVTLSSAYEKPLENAVKVSLLHQGRTIHEELITNEKWEEGHRRTVRFFLDPLVTFIGRHKLDMAVEVQLIPDPALIGNLWRMSIEATGILTEGDRVMLLRSPQRERMGAGHPTIRRFAIGDER